MVKARVWASFPMTLAVAALLVTAIFAGLNGIGAKVLYRDSHFDAFGLLAARGVWTLPFTLALAWFARPARMPSAADWRRIAVLSFGYGPLACGFIALGAERTSGAHLSILLSAAPPVTAFVSALLLRERLDRLRLLALALGVAGAVLLGTTRSATASSLTGDLLIVVTLCGVVSMFVIVRQLAPRYNAVFLTGLFGSMAMVEIGLMGILGGGGSQIMSVWQDEPTAFWFFGLLVFGMAIFCTVGQAYALRIIPAGTAAMLSSYGALAVGLIASVTMLHESISPTGLVAALLIALSIGLALVPGRRPEPVPSES